VGAPPLNFVRFGINANLNLGSMNAYFLKFNILIYRSYFLVAFTFSRGAKLKKTVQKDLLYKILNPIELQPFIELFYLIGYLISLYKEPSKPPCPLSANAYLYGTIKTKGGYEEPD
jgi:hypothetical protein